MFRVRDEKERGSSTLELLGALPVVVLVILTVLQVCSFAWTVSATNQAARDGARALSLGRPVADAVDRSLPGGLDARSLHVYGERVVLEVDVPRFAFVPSMTVRRDATMPETAS